MSGCPKKEMADHMTLVYSASFLVFCLDGHFLDQRPYSEGNTSINRRMLDGVQLFCSSIE